MNKPTIPRLIISGLSGGAGKTMLSLGLARAFARRGLRVQPFKKGPDYIDAAWLALAARAPQANIDAFFTPGPALCRQFTRIAHGCDLALVEGNRGLFDGLDIQGSCSTAEVARLIGAPVLLIVDCTKMTRTTAALVKGCRDFEPGLNLRGVVLNRTGNPRHAALARRAVEELAGVPVLGALPRGEKPFILERHMGLAGTDEGQYDDTPPDAMLETLADFIEIHVELERVLEYARSAPALPGAPDEPGAPDMSCAPMTAHAPAAHGPPDAVSGPVETVSSSSARSPRPASAPHLGRVPRIGYVRDAVLWFYYRENLDALLEAGAELTPLSLLDDKPWPELDGLYLGGGLPELYAQSLSRNRKKLDRLAALCRAGLPVYAECGGFMLLAECLRYQDHNYRMAGVFPLCIEFCEKPQGLGYIEAEALVDTPFHPAGSRFRGHEFHFSRIMRPNADANAMPPDLPEPALRLHRGNGMSQGPDGLGRDGLLCGNTFAAYVHIYAPAVPHWAATFAALCRQNR